MKKTFLITGAGGFIGANFIRHILYNYKDYNVIGVDCLSSMINMHNIYANKLHNFYIADIKDKNIINKIIKIHKPNYIVHLASINRGSHDEILNTNIIGTNNLLDAVECNSNFKKFIYVSNGDIYDSKDRVAEESECSAKNIFQSSILTTENLIQLKAKNNLILRTSSVFGPRSSLQIKNNIINRLYIDLKSGYTKININTNYGDLLYVEDLVQAIVSAIKKDVNGIFNFSIENDFTDEELFYMIKNQLNITDQIALNQDNHKTIKLNSQKFKTLIDYKSEKTLKHRIQQTISWYENNTWFMRA